MKLEHLTPYIPYGVHLMNNYGRWHNTTLHECLSINDMMGMKMILRPLSDLNKKIQIAEFFCSFYDHLERINPSTNETQLCALMLDGSIEMQYYNDYQFLFKNHFDVFGLIDQGLAIDKNTL